MDVCITRDCQLAWVFHRKGEIIAIEPHQFHADCMEQRESVSPEPVDDESPPEETKPPKKWKK